MSSGWRVYFALFAAIAFALIAYALWVHSQRQQELADEVARRAVHDMGPHSRLTKEQARQRYLDYYNGVMNQALDESKKHPMGDWPNEPDGR